MTKSIRCIFVILLMISSQAYSCTEVIPPADVLQLAKKLAYKDFPRVADILSIIRIESAFNRNALNESSREKSRGIMQVNGGPLELNANMVAGVSILRQYYLTTNSTTGAVKAYNIGIGSYLKNKKRISGELYYSKFKTQRKIYAYYSEKDKNSSSNVCRRVNPMRNKFHT